MDTEEVINRVIEVIFYAGLAGFCLFVLAHLVLMHLKIGG